MTITMLFGSRKITRLPDAIRHLLEQKAVAGHEFLVGDAKGADKCFQKWLEKRGYDKVKVFFSGSEPRVHLGRWELVNVTPRSKKRGFAFFVAKDKEMVARADEGLCLWDEESKGSLRNIEQFRAEGKSVYIFSTKRKAFIDMPEISDEKAKVKEDSAEQMELGI